MYVTLRWHSLIRFRRVAVWVYAFVWESIIRACVQGMRDNKKSGGVRDMPSGMKDEYGLSPAAAALTLASIGVSVLRSVYYFTAVRSDQHVFAGRSVSMIISTAIPMVCTRDTVFPTRFVLVK